MPASNTVAFGCVLVMIGALCFCPSVFAETSDSRSVENNSWTATTEWNIRYANPTRIVESHNQNGNRTLDKQSLETWRDSSFQFNEDIETETLQLDADTVRITTRKFGKDGNGRKTLLQVTDEKKTILPRGESNIVRLISSSDLNGALQPIRREVVETKNIGNGVEEANTTVSLPSIYGGLAPAMKVHELHKFSANLKKQRFFPMARETGK